MQCRILPSCNAYVPPIYNVYAASDAPERFVIFAISLLKPCVRVHCVCVCMYVCVYTYVMSTFHSTNPITNKISVTSPRFVIGESSWLYRATMTCVCQCYPPLFPLTSHLLVIALFYTMFVDWGWVSETRKAITVGP
ncbi:hypothetical protein M426DRAFT_145572 [Hypoxylon sp. CI-4A]|nr:hypothetical protein M426DRAFT_145572 [Hypoxylon sp. CI-4A]